MLSIQETDLTLFPSDYTPAGVLTTNGTGIPSSATAGGANPTGADTPIAGGGGGLSTGAKAGIGAGIAAAVVVGIGVVAFLLRKKRRQKKQKKPFPEVTELPGSHHPRDVPELDSVNIYEAPGATGSDRERERERAQPDSSTQSGSRADTLVGNVSRPKLGTMETPVPGGSSRDITTVDSRDPTTAVNAMPPPENGDFGTATTLEALELQYLEAEERRIQERRAQLLQKRDSPVAGER
ncbi:hypothetical protein LTR84_011697 [Exophiala bonariae]|uniref:Gram-positive cocci surface proteins LPxTG domain-containing protein n=1 Tax=Exophiala bonariae TaxID=1690606 RepID=A0AAV9NJ65_9EURO|nr:hypothetical protein LTR84_011697 [Exophiala bonariae]